MPFGLLLKRSLIFSLSTAALKSPFASVIFLVFSAVRVALTFSSAIAVW